MRRLPLAVLLLCAAQPAWSADTKLKLAVMDLQERGVDRTLAASATSLLASELQKLDVFRVISREDIRNMLSFEKDRQSVGCEADNACLAEIGGALGVEYIVNGSLAKIGEQYVLNLVLNSVKSAQIENRTTSEVARQEQIVATVSRDARILVSKVLKGREGFLVLTVAEEGATVKVDGLIRGTTPLRGRLPLAWGPHLLEIERTGFVTFSEDISVPAKQVLAKSVSLLPSNDFIDRYEGSAKKMRLGAWITTGLAVAGIGAAVAFNQMSASTESEFLPKRTQSLASPNDAALAQQVKDLSSQGSTQVFLSRLGLGVGLAALGLATYFWVAGDDPYKYEAFREVGGAPEQPKPVEAPGTQAPKDAPKEILKAARPAARGPAFAVGAVPLPSGAALLLAGHF